MILPRVESSDNANTFRFYVSMNRLVFLLVPYTLKWPLLLLCSGIISSSFCFSFDHLWRFYLRKDNYWLSYSYSLAKYNSWTCALLEFYTRSPQIKSTIFLRIFEDMTPSIEFGCAVLMSRSDKEDICSHRIWLWFCMYFSTCLIKADELLLYAATMV